MKRKLTAFLLALLLALTLCSPALAGAEYGSFYDETEQISSDELTNLGEETFPQLSKTLGVDLRVDVFTDEGVEDSTVRDIATYVYGNSDYGLGEEKEGISLTLLLRAQPDGSYAMAEKDWCVYVSLSQARGNAQELTDVVSDAVKPYMAERAWNGKDLTMSATALAQAMGAMAEASSNYILANCPPDGVGKTTETPEPVQEPAQEPAQDGADETTETQDLDQESAEMNYIFDLSDQLTAEEWQEAEARAADISQRHNCGVYVVFVDNFKKYGDGDDVYKTTYELYHANELGMGEGRDGIIILLSMAERDYAMFVYGENASYAFNAYGQKQLEDAFLGYFSDNDWCGGVSHYLDTCDEYLTLAEDGTPVRSSPVPLIIAVVAGSCVIALVVCLILRAKMKSVHKGVDANVYATGGGLTLTDSYDHYSHTTESRTKIVDESKSGGGGGSTTSRSGGGGSGRSGKF